LNMSDTVLIVDDRLRLCESLQASLEERGYRALIATTGAEALAIFQADKVDAVFLDVRLGEEDGLEVFARLRAIDPLVPVVVVTGYGTVESAVAAIKEGAFDYLQKPIKVEKLLKVLENALRLSVLERENRELHCRSRPPFIASQSPLMKAMLERLVKLASSEMPILVRGESGTGKELVAEFIHAASFRAKGALEKINCAAFPESLLDNELFGHEKGAFTGASAVFYGVFERANGGTLFLDEVGDMPPSIQAKILRAIQNKEIRRIGGSDTITVDIRFVAATNKDLEALVAQGAFRSDLLYRLNTATVLVPPLRDRPEDIVPLAKGFLGDFSAMSRARGLAPETIEALLRYSWPGNVRELKGVIQYACTVASSEAILPDDLPDAVHEASSEPLSLGPREALERSLMLRALKDSNYNKTEAARRLKMSRVTLYSKMEKYGIGNAAAPRP
jgi:DNA-binding NtrC family response regulator